jgi:hypothetical protein
VQLSPLSVRICLSPLWDWEKHRWLFSK